MNIRPARVGSNRGRLDRASAAWLLAPPLMGYGPLKLAPWFSERQSTNDPPPSLLTTSTFAGRRGLTTSHGRSGWSRPCGDGNDAAPDHLWPLRERNTSTVGLAGW